MSLDDRSLSEDGWDGYYRTDNGYLIEMHEWEDWFDPEELEEGDKPDGAVYYDVFKDGDVVDGGVLGYREGDDIGYFNDWFSKAHNRGYGRVSEVVALETSPEFDKIEKFRYRDVPMFARFCAGLGLKNRKGFKDRYKGQDDVGTLAHHLNESAYMHDPYGYCDEFSSSETNEFCANSAGYEFFMDGLVNGDREFYRQTERGLAESISAEHDRRVKKGLIQARKELKRRRKQLFGRG